MKMVAISKPHAARVLLASSAIALALGAAPASAADLSPVIPPAPPIVVPVAVPGPMFEIHVTGLFMTRRNPDPAPLVSFYPLPGTGDVIDASDLDYNWRPGIEARAGLILPSGIGFELRGMWVAPMSASLVTDPDDDVLLNTDDPTEFADIAIAAAVAETRLWSVEANATLALGGGFQLFGGATVVRLTDVLGIGLAQDDDTGGGAGWAAINRMIGPQVGARMKTGDGQNGFFFAAEARVGLLFNRIINVFGADTTDIGGGAFDGADATTSRVLMAAGNLNVGYQVSERLAVHLGYQAMWLNNVALAPDQVGNTGELDIPGTVTLTTTTNSFLAHGVRFGLDLTF